jgi:hypothetical protein
MKQVSLPCGCLLTWDASESTIILCPEHLHKYQKRKVSTEEFIKVLITSKTCKLAINTVRVCVCQKVLSKDLCLLFRYLGMILLSAEKQCSEYVA